LICSENRWGLMAKNIMRAAGGVVCRPADDGELEVLLVGGAADNPDYWGFPKGKQNEGEPIEATAVREVGEETGLRIELLALAGDTRYTFTRPDGRLQNKTVRYYLARAVGGSMAERDAEREFVAWLPARQAADRLTYPDDRAILHQALTLLAQHPLYRSML
jgi:8-oxo-dGTP pyrophosphatase MutT (NUDIX family)